MRALAGSWWIIASVAIIFAALFAIGYFFIRPAVDLFNTVTSPTFAEDDLSTTLDPLKDSAALHPDTATLVRTWSVTDCYAASGSPFARFHYLTSDSAEANIAFFQTRLIGTDWSMAPRSPGLNVSKQATFKRRVQGRTAFLNVSQLVDGELEVTLSSPCRLSDPG